jgi:hypothetical protein
MKLIRPTPRRRATDHVRARPMGFFGYLRLRHKLALMLSIAALLPVLGASTVAMRLVLAGLKSGVRSQTERTMRVALNLVLSNVKEVFEQAIRLSETAGLSDLLLLDPESTSDLIMRKETQLMPGLVEIADETGRVVGRRIVGGARMGTTQSSTEAIRGALSYERRVTLARGASAGSPIIIRASAPVVDDAYQLRGAVVVSVPLDAEFADRLKAQLSADVVVYQGDAPTASSFVAVDGRREVGFAAPRDVAGDVLRGMTRVVEAAAYGRTFSVGYAPLQDFERHRLGMLAHRRQDRRRGGPGAGGRALRAAAHASRRRAVDRRRRAPERRRAAAGAGRGGAAARRSRAHRRRALRCRAQAARRQRARLGLAPGGAAGAEGPRPRPAGGDAARVAALHRRRSASGGDLRQPGSDGHRQRPALRRGAEVVG